MDRLRAISVFASVVEEGSFAAAADRLRLSRTAASKHVMQLEAHLGVTLLNRTTRRVSPTPSGLAYYSRVKRALEVISDADSEAAEQSRDLRGRVRVSAPASFGVRHVAPQLVGFMDLNPRVEIDLVLNDRQVDLVEEGFDLAIRIGRLADSSLVGRRIASARLIVCASPSYLEKRGRPSTPKDLTDHACLGYHYGASRNEWELVDRDGTLIRVPVKSHLWSNSGDALLKAAVSGAGIGILPDFIAGQALGSGALVELLDGYCGPEMGVHILYLPTTYMPLRVRLFIDYLAEQLAASIRSSSH